MITIDPKSFHARWFRYWAQCWAQFTDQTTAPGKSGTTSLCIYFWVCVGAPVFIGFLHAMTGAALFYVFVYDPIFVMSPMLYLAQWGVLAVIGLSIWGFIVARRGYLNRPAPTSAGVWELITEYLVATKRRVCPIIKIGEQS